VLHLLEFRFFNFLIFFHILFALFLTPHVVILCVVPFTLFLLCCSLMFLFILLLSHYSFCIAFFCDVVPLALFFSRCLFLRYYSLQVVALLKLPLLALLFFTSCCSFRIIVLRVLSFLSRCRLFCVVLLTQLLLSCNFSYVVALVLLFSHCNSRIFPLAL
jgi:hypothetical protein